MKKINPRILNFFDALSDETRLNIIISISKKPLTVNDIHKFIPEITLSGISHQLKLLSNLGIVEYEKEGRKRFYRLSHDYCWCILKDAFNTMNKKTKCSKCVDIEKTGGL